MRTAFEVTNVTQTYPVSERFCMRYAVCGTAKRCDPDAAIPPHDDVHLRYQAAAQLIRIPNHTIGIRRFQSRDRIWIEIPIPVPESFLAAGDESGAIGITHCWYGPMNVVKLDRGIASGAIQIPYIEI
jgi:hypothetical protein